MKDILINMQGGNITPSMASNYRVRLSAIYSTNNERIKQLMSAKAEHYKASREVFKSDKACEMDFLTSDMGKEYTNLLIDQKSIDKLMTSLNSYLKNAENEAKNIY